MVKNGYVAGDNGRIKPTANITREEFAMVMYQMVKQYIREPGEYTSVIDGNVMITSTNVVLKDVTINGDLILGDGIGLGQVTFENVTVTGRTIVRSGSSDTIVSDEASDLGEIVLVSRPQVPSGGTGDGNIVTPGQPGGGGGLGAGNGGNGVSSGSGNEDTDNVVSVKSVSIKETSKTFDLNPDVSSSTEFTFTATISPTNATNKNIDWSVDKNDKADLSDNATTSGKEVTVTLDESELVKGDVITVTATSRANKSAKASVKITVVDTSEEEPQPSGDITVIKVLDTLDSMYTAEVFVTIKQANSYAEAQNYEVKFVRESNGREYPFTLESTSGCKGYHFRGEMPHQGLPAPTTDPSDFRRYEALKEWSVEAAEVEPEPTEYTIHGWDIKRFALSPGKAELFFKVEGIDADNRETYTVIYNGVTCSWSGSFGGYRVLVDEDLDIDTATAAELNAHYYNSDLISISK